MHRWQSRVCTLLHRASPGSQVPCTPSTWRLVNLPLTTRLRKAFSQAKLEKAHVAQYSHPCQPRPILSLTRHRSCGVTMCRVDSASRIHRRRTSSAQPLTCLKHSRVETDAVQHEPNHNVTLDIISAVLSSTLHASCIDRMRFQSRTPLRCQVRELSRKHGSSKGLFVSSAVWDLAHPKCINCV